MSEVNGLITGAQSFTVESGPTMVQFALLQQSVDALLHRVGDLEARVAILEQSK